MSTDIALPAVPAPHFVRPRIDDSGVAAELARADALPWPSGDRARDLIVLPLKLNVVTAEALAARDRGSRAVVFALGRVQIDMVVDALRRVGLRVGVVRDHDDRHDLDRFLGRDTPTEDQVDVLVGDYAISVGVAGMERVADTLVLASPARRVSAFNQLVSRLVRVGQRASVRVVVPDLQPYAE